AAASPAPALATLAAGGREQDQATDQKLRALPTAHTSSENQGVDQEFISGVAPGPPRSGPGRRYSASRGAATHRCPRDRARRGRSPPTSPPPSSFPTHRSTRPTRRSPSGSGGPARTGAGR